MPGILAVVVASVGCTQSPYTRPQYHLARSEIRSAEDVLQALSDREQLWEQFYVDGATSISMLILYADSFKKVVVDWTDDRQRISALALFETIKRNRNRYYHLLPFVKKIEKEYLFRNDDVMPLDFLSVLAQRLLFSYLRAFTVYDTADFATNRAPSRSLPDMRALSSHMASIIHHTTKHNKEAKIYAERVVMCLTGAIELLEGGLGLKRLDTEIHEYERCLVDELLSLKRLLHL